MTAAVAVVAASRSDLPVMRETCLALREMGIPFRLKILSAHRHPDAVVRFAEDARRKGVRVIVAGAGGAAHLAGAIAARTVVPVIGVPLVSGPLGGVDAFFSTLQMPAGVPVATMSVGRAGAVNAAILAARILAVPDLRADEAAPGKSSPKTPRKRKA